MKLQINLLIALASIFLLSCSNGQNKITKTSLTAKEFSEMLLKTPNPTIIDVRSPDEFKGGHLTNAQNINWNGGDFQNQIASIDKNKPVFVYCFSGARSASAAANMRTQGFKEVYEMEGGMIKWRAAGLPEANMNAAATKGMSKADYEKMIQSDKLVLVDFYATWCQPCQKMKPYLDEISKDMASKVQIIRVDADQNPDLAKGLGVDALPTLFLYKGGKETWHNTGYMTKDELVAKLK